MSGWQPTGGSSSRIWGEPQSVVQETWTSIEHLQEDGSLHHIVDVGEHLARGHDLLNLVKRCLVSSSFVVLKTPPLLYRQPGPDEALVGISAGWDMPPEQRALENVLLAEGFDQSEFCIILPQQMKISVEVSGGEALDSYFEQTKQVNKEIEKLEAHVYSLPVGADYAMVRRLLKQDSSRTPMNTGVMMPEIGNLSLADLTQLRKDYDGPFARLRYALKKHVDGIAEFDSEQKFKGVIEEIDHECRMAQDEFERIQRKHSRSLPGLLIISSLVGVAVAAEVFVAPGVLAAASATLGSFTLSNVLSKRIVKLDNVDDLGKSDYWIALKIQQENARRGLV